MLFADHDLLARQGHVDCFGLQLVRERGLLNDQLLLFDYGFDLGAHVVDELAYGRAFLCGNVLHALEERGQLSFFAKELDARFVKRARVRGGGKLFLCGLQDALQLFFHGCLSFLYEKSAFGTK